MNHQTIVIGAGPAGYVCALRLAQLGQDVAIVEKRALGGTCLNVGCVPTKSLLKEVHHHQDSASLTGRKEAVIENQEAGIAGLLKAAKVTIYTAEARIAAGPTVELSTGETLTAREVVVAAGASPAKPPIPGMELAGVMTSDDVLSGELPIPKRIAIVGGGVIGVEMASLYADLHCEVIIIEALPRLLANMDKELGQSLAAQFKKEGIRVINGAKVQSINAEGKELVLTYEVKDKRETLTVDGVLVATGRKSVATGMFTDNFTPNMDRGAIVVDENFQTSLPNVYAIGDVTPSIQLAHFASAQGKALAEKLAGQVADVDLSLVPACVYTTPEIAVVGMDEASAKEAGVETISGKYLMGGNAKTVIDGLPRSFIKLIFAADDHRIIGGVLYCGRASDLVAAVTLAIRAKMTAEEISATIFAHPTYAEAIGEAAESALGKCVHVAQRIR